MRKKKLVLEKGGILGGGRLGAKNGPGNIFRSGKYGAGVSATLRDAL
jgi:hypothetical protein